MSSNKYVSDVFLDFNKNVFRDIGFNESRKDILNKEKDRLDFKDTLSNALFYEHIFPKDTTAKALEYAEITYFFNEDKLDVITLTYYLNEEADMDSIADVLGKVFTAKYGKPYTDPENYEVWDANFNITKRKTLKYDIAVKKIKEPYQDTKLSIEYIRY